MSVPRKHHFLAEFYLRGFAAGGHLWTHDRRKGVRRRLRPETVGIRKSFYSVEGEDGRKDHEGVERRLGVIESQAAAIRKIEAGGTLGLPEKFALALIGSTSVTETFSKWEMLALKLSPLMFRLWPYGDLKRRIAKATAIEPEVQSYALDAADRLSKSEFVAVWNAVAGCLHEEPGYRLPVPCC